MTDLSARTDFIIAPTRPNEVLIWGGRRGFGASWPAFCDGALVDTANGAHTPASRVGALSARAFAVSASTAAGVIVWGGQDEGGSLGDGAICDPSSGTWQPMRPAPLCDRAAAASVWTGAELIVWGGCRIRDRRVEPLADGAAFDPVSGTWRLLPPAPLTGRRSPCAALQRGQWLLWGGDGTVQPPPRLLGDGAAYDIERDKWRALPLDGAPEPRWWPGYARSAHGLVIHGGAVLTRGALVPVADGARFDATTWQWQRTTAQSNLSPRVAPIVVPSNDAVLMVGGTDGARWHDDGHSLQDDESEWQALSAFRPLAPVQLAQGVHTDSGVYFWGGPEARGWIFAPPTASMKARPTPWSRLEQTPPP